MSATKADGPSYKQDVSEAEFCLPVPLEHVDADLSFVAHIGVKNLGQEITLGWNRREILPKDQAHSENASSKRSSLCQSMKNSFHQQCMPNVLSLRHKTGHRVAEYKIETGEGIQLRNRLFSSPLR